ncbi:MAG: hypothetical protein ACI9HY_003596, partial [Planctomycetaceae bacterium]
ANRLTSARARGETPVLYNTSTACPDSLGINSTPCRLAKLKGSLLLAAVSLIVLSNFRKQFYLIVFKCIIVCGNLYIAFYKAPTCSVLTLHIVSLG